MKAEAEPIEDASIAAPTAAANEKLANFFDSIVFSFVVPQRREEEHAPDERKMKRGDAAAPPFRKRLAER